MSKRVHEIAKERGLPAKEVLEKLRAAGINVKAVSSSVDEAAAAKALGNGGARPAEAQADAKPAGKSGNAKADNKATADKPRDAKSADGKAAGGNAGARAPRAEAQAPARQTPAQAAAPAEANAAPPTDAKPNGDGAGAPADGADGANRGGGDAPHKRPTRDSLQGERAPGTAGGRRRVVIDSQASRRAPGGGPPPASNQPPRRQRRGRRRRGVYDEEAESRPSQTAIAEPDVTRINSGSTVKAVAEYLDVSSAEIIKKLMALGEMKTLTQTLSDDTIQVLASELGQDVEIVHSEDEEIAEPVFDDAAEDLVERAPVVTIMGHVDHGKTSLLDYIRRTKVASGEAGGITQHIGAYHVDTPKGVITFLDTPGHAAFTSMRARGAQSTDIVVLVVAADDGVMPQTAEAVQHARAAKVPLIVAINKMDKSDANPDHVKQGLGNLEVIPEEWGGDTPFVPLSAKTGMGIDALLDAISVQAEVMELTAVEDGPASGVVIESSLDRGRGPVATVLVQQGTLKRGDFVVCGIEFGRMRALVDETGKTVQEAGPSIPVQILGLSGVPESGDDFVVVADERLAREVAAERAQKRRDTRMVSKANRLEDIIAQMGQGAAMQTLNILVKADVQGSVQALRESLSAIGNENVKVNVIAAGVGGITESDATLAAASKALVIGFNVRADASARKVIDTAGLDVRYFSIIYDVIDQVKQAASGLLGVEIREEIIGIAQVRDVFRSSKFGAVAGCMVTEGHVKRSKPIRVLRDNTVVFEGELESLRRFKDLVDEVRSGMECGIAVKQYNDVKVGDQIECFERIEVARTL